jgi:hypothetical protein
MSPKLIEIEVCGHEKASYKVRRHDHTQNRDYDHQEVVEKDILGFKGVCFTFQAPI